ncbi:MAG: flagellar basal body rod protein FlgB [Campylobacterota bacterium]|nr:flagellar basal body rod protein FlgB [Campylobacterota bacterium]
MEASGVTDLLFKQLNFRGEQQKVTATNIANIDTPGFKTKELKFNDQLKKSQNEYDLELSRTHKNHMRIEPISSGKDFTIQETKGLDEQNDGNNVNLDTQMSTMAQNSMMFNAIQNSIKKDSSWFKSVIDASGKN